MEHDDYQKILDAMPETGIYVIREDDHGLLYFNKRVESVSPQVRPGMTCHEVWTGSCVNCPLLTIRDRQQSRSISYNPTFGGVVDMVATRILWQETIPAFVVTVTPRIEAAGYNYRKILRLNLSRNRYDVLKSDAGSLLSEGGTENLSAELDKFAQSGIIHPEDVERFKEFTALEHLRSALQSGKSMLTCIYRRLEDDDFRWNLIEVVRAFDYNENNPTAVFCVKDVHDTMKEGLEREEADARSLNILRTMGEQSFSIYSIDLNTGSVSPIRVEGRIPKETSSPRTKWDELMNSQLRQRLHAAYRETFEAKFSLSSLRGLRDAGEQETELLCQWEDGGKWRYVSITARMGHDYGSKGECVILTLEDMDDRIRKELSHSRHDMQMAAILKSRFTVMNTVNPENGQCERVYLSESYESSGPQDALIGDYNYHMQQALDRHVHPEDAVYYSDFLSLEHLRETAAKTDNYLEEICRYRTRREPVQWIEQHVIYSRQDDRVVVNILGHDITKEKSREDERLQALQDRAYIISSLSSLFFSTYYINLERDTFRAVTQLGKIGDVLGSEVNCTAALRVHAENFIHPDDREEYLKIMSIPNLLQSLRWWHPYVTATYRKIPENSASGTYSWVRATAVLAQVGDDDIPKTAVYVAQDITETMQKQHPQEPF